MNQSLEKDKNILQMVCGKKKDNCFLPNPTITIRRQIPTARCLTYRFQKKRLRTNLGANK